MPLHHDRGFKIGGLQAEHSKIVQAWWQLVQRIDEDQPLLVTRHLRLQHLIWRKSSTRLYHTVRIEQPFSVNREIAPEALRHLLQFFVGPLIQP